MHPEPYAPIMSAELSGREARTLEIREAIITGPKGRVIRTCSSAVVFAFLAELGAEGGKVNEFIHDGREIEATSLAALNSYIRTGALDRGAFPFSTTDAAGNHRFAWNDFCRHLALTFGPPVDPHYDLDQPQKNDEG